MAGTQVPMDEGMHGFVAEPLVRMEDNEVVNVSNIIFISFIFNLSKIIDEKMRYLL